MKRSGHWYVLGVLLGTVWASLCSAQTVKVGVILPLTGPFARYGERIQQAIVATKNPKVAFQFEDEGCDPKMAVTAYKKLTDLDNIKLFLGPWCGSPQSAIAAQLKLRGQLALLGSSAPQSVYVAASGNMLSVQHSIETESTFLAQKMNQERISSVAIIFNDNAFSRAHEAAFRAAYKGKILATFAYTSVDVSELKGIALKVRQLQPEALYVPDAFPLMAGFTKELRSLGVGKKIYSVYSVQSEDVLQALGSEGKHLIYSYPDIGTQNALDHFPTLATKLLLEAVSVCGDEVSCVRKYLLQRNSFDAFGVLSGALTLKTIKDGQFTGLE